MKRAIHLLDGILLVACRADVGDPRFMTSDPLAVSCKGCKRTKAYRAAVERFEEEEPRELSEIGAQGRDAIERHRDAGLVTIGIEPADPEEFHEKVETFLRNRARTNAERVEAEYAARTAELKGKR